MTPIFPVSRFQPALSALKGCALVGTFLFFLAVGAPLAHAQVAPVLSPVSISSSNAHPSVAKTGDTITLTFTSDTSLDGVPTVTIAGDAATTALDATNTFGTSTVTLSGSEPQGPVTFSISNYSTTTNGVTTQGTAVTSTTDGSSVNFDGTAPTLTSAKITAPNQITLLFSEPVLSTTADFTNFTVSPSDIRTISSVTGSSTNTLVLSFSGTSTPVTATGTLSIASTLTDLVGNPLAATTTAVADGQATAAPGTPTVSSALVGSSAEQSGFAIFVPITGTGAAVGDSVELLLNGSSFSPSVMRQIVSPFDLIAGQVTLGITHGQLGADGVKNITARITDAAGNVSTSSGILALTLDTVSPTLSSGKITGPNQATLIFSEPVIASTTSFSNLSVVIGGSRTITSVAASSTSVTLTFNGAPLAASSTGFVYVTGSLTDLADNAFAAATTTLTDGQAPSASLAFSKDPAHQGDSETITATLTEPVTSAPTIALSGANTVSATAMTPIDSLHYSFTYTVGAGNGTTTATLGGAMDAAGNAIVATPTGTASFTVDNTPPSGSMVVSKTTAKQGDSITLTITSTKPIAISAPIQISVSGADTLAATTTTRVDSTHYTITYPVTGSGNGSATIVFVGGTDIAGNSIAAVPTAGGSYTVDNTAPTATVLASQNPTAQGSVETLSITTSEPIATTTPVQIRLSGTNTLASTTVSTIDPTHFTFSYTVTGGTGTTTVSLGGGTDLAGNAIISVPTSGTQFFVDNTPPTFTTPANVTMEATGTTTPVVLGSVTNLSDNTDPHPTVSNNAPSAFPVGTTTVVWTARDNLGNTSTSSQLVIIRDTTPPTIHAPVYQTFEATAVNSSPILAAATATDIADPNPAITYAPHSFALGTTTVTWTATDASGNTTSTTSLVTIVDTTPPHIAPLGTQTFEATGVTTTPMLAHPTVTDLADPNPTLTYAPHSFALGTTTVTWTATDATGNVSTSTSQVVIVDTLPPLISPLGNILLEATGPSGSVATYATPFSLDTVSGPEPVTCLPASGTVFALGTTTITCSATDAAGNTGSTTALVVVRDTTAPTIVTPQNITTEATSPAGATVSFPIPSATDAVSGTTTVTCAPISGSTFALGTTTPVCSSTDAAGNTASTSFQVGVVDTTPPQITAHVAVIAEAASPAGTAVSFALPMASDTVDGVTAVSCNPNSGSTFQLGTTTVHCSSTDAHGNTGHSSFNVVVQDTTPPQISALGAQTFEATGPQTTPVLTAPAVIDNGDANPTIIYAPHSFGLGHTTVTWTATDASGNAATMTSVVNIVDTTAPVITVPPTQTFGAMGVLTTPILVPATAADLVDPNPAVTYAPHSFALGTTTVTWTATDAQGNVSTATSLVVIGDVTAPLIAPHGNVSAEAASAAGANVTYALPTATDNVDGTDAVVCAPVSGSLFSIGTTTVHCSSTDAAGNTATSSFSVSVVDTTAPTIVAPASQTFEATGPQTTPILVQATSTDLVDPNPAITYDIHSFGLGITTVTWTATDSFGNSTTTSSLVTIIDTTAPTLSAVQNIQAGAQSAAGATVTFAVPTATDLVDGTDAVICLPASGSLFPMGNTTVTCSTQDAQGNATSTSFTVSVTNTFNIGASVTLNPTSPTVVVSTSTTATSTISVPSTIQNPTLDLSAIVTNAGSNVTASIGGALSAVTNASAGNVSLDLPAGEVITGPAGWNGIFELPTFDSTQPAGPFAPVGQISIISSVVEVGVPGEPLSLSRAARILMPGEAGKHAGFTQVGSAQFTDITATCAADDQTTADAQLGSNPNACVIDVGPDLVIWTNHFTSFVTYTLSSSAPRGNTAPSVSNGAPVGISSGAGSYVAPMLPYVPSFFAPPSAGGQVLGAATSTVAMSTAATSTTPVILPIIATSTPVKLPIATTTPPKLVIPPLKTVTKPVVPKHPRLGAGEVIPPPPTHLSAPAPVANKPSAQEEKQGLWTTVVSHQVAAPSALSIIEGSAPSTSSTSTVVNPSIGGMLNRALQLLKKAVSF